MTGPAPLHLWRRNASTGELSDSHGGEYDGAAPETEERGPRPRPLGRPIGGTPDKEHNVQAAPRARILIIGTASVSTVQACVSALDGQGELLLLLPEKHQGSFSGCRVHRFSGLLSSRAEYVRLLRDFDPEQAVVAVGALYFHNNVVGLLTTYCALTGRALRASLFRGGELIAIADAPCVPPRLRGRVVAPRVHLGDEAYALMDDALSGALTAWRRSGKAGAGDVAYVDGLRFGLQDEAYESGEQFYRWLRDDRDRLHVILNPPRCDLLPGKGRHGDLDSKIEILDGLREALAAWPHASDGIVLAVSRMLAREGRVREARARLSAQLLSSPSHSLENALHTVNLLLDGHAVPEYLRRFVGDDGPYLQDRICPAPFVNFFVSNDGSTWACCGHFLRTPVGNILESSAEDTLNSPVARDIRRSVAEGTYKYCDLVKCSYIASGTLPVKSEVLALHENDGTSKRLEDMVASGDWRGLPVVADAARPVRTGDYRIASPKHIIFGLDLSCNLRCPSCRTELKMESQDVVDVMLEVTKDKILPLAKQSVYLEINPSGELFASKVSLKAVSLLNRHDYPKLLINIISNGTLFTEERWEKLTNIHSMINSIRISVDASSKLTFETLRLGGNWDAMLANLQFISSLRRSNVAKRFSLSFTYQEQNYQEMPAFVALAKSLQCDAVLFEQLQNVHWSNADFLQRAVNRKEHPAYKQFREVSRNQALQDPIVFMDLRDP